MLQDSDVVITGIGVITPIGSRVERFWQSLVEGRSGISEMDGVDPAGFGQAFGGYVTDFDGRDHVKPRKAMKVMSRELQMGYAASMLALEHAGIVLESLEPQRVATVFGSEMLYGPPDEMRDTFQAIFDAVGFEASSAQLVQKWGELFPASLFPLWMLKYLPNMPACHVGIAINAQGPNNTVVLDDCSGLAALQEATEVIRRGAADVALVGAAGTRVGTTRLLYRGALKYASRRAPIESTCRPYAADRDGYVGAEGAATIVLESREHARRRQATILGRVAAVTNQLIAPPQGQIGSQAAIRGAIASAMRRADVTADALSHIDGHAMGELMMDAAEAQAIAEVLPEVPVTASKSLLGHSGAACGLVELAGALLSLRHQQIPATYHVDQLDVECPVRLVREPQPSRGRAVLKLSHSPQGQAMAAIIRAES